MSVWKILCCLYIKVEVAQWHDDASTKRQQRYSSNSFETMALVAGTRNGRSTPGKTLAPTEEVVAWALGMVQMVTEYLASNGISSPTRPARSKSLHKTHHPGCQLYLYEANIFGNCTEFLNVIIILGHGITG